MTEWTTTPLRYFHNRQTNDFFTSYENHTNGGIVIELPKEVWEARKEQSERIELDTLLAKYIIATKKLKKAKDAADEAKRALYGLVFDEDELAKQGTHKRIREVVSAETGEVRKFEFKASVSVKIEANPEALELLRPSIPEDDFNKIFKKDFKVDKRVYDALPEQSKKFLASAITSKAGAPSYSYEVVKDE